MGFHKGHKEFHTLDMQDGWHVVPGYPPGFSEKILAGSLDEKGKRGNRTRLLRIEPGAFSTVPFVHDYWEEVFLLSGDLICGNDEHGKGRRTVQGLHLCGAPARRLSRAVHLEDRLPVARDALLRRNVRRYEPVSRAQRTAISAFTRVFNALWWCAADPGS